MSGTKTERFLVSILVDPDVPSGVTANDIADAVARMRGVVRAITVADVAPPTVAVEAVASKLAGEIGEITFDRCGGYEYDIGKVSALIEAALLTNAGRRIGDDALSDAISRALSDSADMAMTRTLRDVLHQRLFNRLKGLRV